MVIFLYLWNKFYFFLDKIYFKLHINILYRKTDFYNSILKHRI